MYAKYLCTILAVLSLGLVETKLVPAPRDIFDTAAALLADLDEAVNFAIDEALPELELLGEQLNVTAATVEATAEVEIQDGMNILDAEVENIRQQGYDAGVEEGKVNNCLTLYGIEMALLPIIVRNDIRACLSNTCEEGTVIINRSIEQVLRTRDSVTYLELQLEQCRLLPNGQECALGLVEVIAIEIIDLPARVKEDTEKAKAVATALGNTLDTCSQDRIGIINSSGQDILQSMRDCVGL